MRLVVAIVVFACVTSAAHAQDARESRYGPSAEREASTQTASLTYNGPMLGWAGKAPIAAPDPVPASAPSAAVPTAPAPAPATAPQSRLAAAAAAYTPEPSAPWRQLGAQSRPQVQATPVAAPVAALRPAAPLPQSLYATPAAPPALQLALRPPLPAAASPPNADTLGPSLSRTYSVGRQYGLQPDALPPLKPNGMVYIAPSDAPATAKADAPRHGSAEWLAGGPLGDEPGREAGKDVSLR